MSSNHKAPLAAFVVVAIACVVVLATNSMRSYAGDALRTFAAPVVSGLQLIESPRDPEPSTPAPSTAAPSGPAPSDAPSAASVTLAGVLHSATHTSTPVVHHVSTHGIGQIAPAPKHAQTHAQTPAHKPSPTPAVAAPVVPVLAPSSGGHEGSHGASGHQVEHATASGHDEGNHDQGNHQGWSHAPGHSQDAGATTTTTKHSSGSFSIAASIRPGVSSNAGHGDVGHGNVSTGGPGHSAEAHGHSGEAPGHSGDAHGRASHGTGRGSAHGHGKH